jgi:hypothetical protein
VTGVDKEFERYFAALDRSGGQDRCYLCRRAPVDVKAFFGFDEDGHPTEAQEYGIEDVVLEESNIMSYRGLRPICAVCQLNLDAIFMLDEEAELQAVLNQMRDEREKLWPDSDRPPQQD